VFSKSYNFATIAVVASLLISCGSNNEPPSSASSDSSSTDTNTNYTVRATTSNMGYNTFYKQYCEVYGLDVLSSDLTDDNALYHVCYQIDNLFKDSATRESILSKMKSNNMLVAIMDKTEVTTDIPEHSDLPSSPWDTYRGLGATTARPASSAAEENILCYTGDKYTGENIFIHEFAHSIHLMALNYLDGTFTTRLTNAYNAAIGGGKWSNTYAATNAQEYWAEGVQSWFNANREAEPADGVHNHVNTRSELLAYDKTLHDLIAEVFSTTFQPACP